MPSSSSPQRPELEAGRESAGSPFYDGDYLLATPRFKALTATIPASGSLVVNAPAPRLGPGQESSIVYCQAFFRAPAGRFVLSSPAAVVLLDASY